MGFIKNKIEDWENFLINSINFKEIYKMKQEKDELEILKKSMDYRQADVQFLFQEGFSWEPKKKGYFKEENINYGKWPGKYLISVHFPDSYPKTAPVICFEPLFTNKSISPHIHGHNGYKWHVCIAQSEGGSSQSYWKEYMNARGALMLAYSIVTNEYKRTNGSRREIPIKGTVFDRLKKVVSKEVFIKEFMEAHKIMVDKTFTWGELAFKVSQTESKIKSEVVMYYNSKRKKNG